MHNVLFDVAMTAGIVDAVGAPSSGRSPRREAYPYHCTIHGPAMSGTITVAASAPVAAAGGGGGGDDY